MSSPARRRLKSCRWIQTALAALLAAVAILLTASALAPTLLLAAPAHSAVTAKPKPPAAPKTPAKTGGEGEGEGAASAPTSEGDVLAGNGLGSPLCQNPGVLSAADQRNCETSDFVAAPDPTGDYAFDVNINTGITDIGNDIATTIENLMQFAWMGLVALIHGLLVMFEWCYSLNLLSGEVMSEVAHGLHETQLTFTKPWMIVVLAIASVLATYHGLVRRRVAETMGQVLMMMAMMLGGLWVIVNPAGTVGVLENMADQASLGTLSAVTNGNPSNAKRNLATNMQYVFSTVVSAPWCYMEFGDVNWCHNPHLLDPKLMSAAKKIAETEEEEAKCSGSCSGASPKSRQEAISAQLLRSARTNGELFLALPANGEQRNSVKNEGTLLAELCEESGPEASADKCKGETAPQAEFRTEKGTGSRVMGLIMIWVGSLGMLLLFGFLALRLLEAAIASLFYLLLAPAAVLAPALGDGGRSAFRGWITRLLAAVISKLIYSFFLGVVLVMMKVLLHADALGWWAQWLLISALWWVALHHRHKVMGFARGSQNDFETRSMRWFYRVRMAQDLGRLAGWARHKLTPPPPKTERSGGRGSGGGRGGPRKPGGGPGSGGKGTGGKGTGGQGTGGTGGSGGEKKGSGTKGSERQRPTPERSKPDPDEAGDKPPDKSGQEDGEGRPQSPDREQPERLVPVAKGNRSAEDPDGHGPGKGEKVEGKPEGKPDAGRKLPNLGKRRAEADQAEQAAAVAAATKDGKAPATKARKKPSAPQESGSSGRPSAPPTPGRSSAPRPPSTSKTPVASQQPSTQGVARDASERSQPRSAAPPPSKGQRGARSSSRSQRTADAYVDHVKARAGRNGKEETSQQTLKRQQRQELVRSGRQVSRPPTGKK
ncbi:MAG: hypothetical protein ACRDK2_16820 [Solirubrobacteraceae bacterium]